MIQSATQRAIEILSPPQDVNMGNDWYQYANSQHFWIRRRFDVVRRLANLSPGESTETWGEVGCGHGLVQKQFESELGISVDGIDLNEHALRQNVANRGRLFCYDVTSVNGVLDCSYDRLLLLDVIEHLDQDVEFLKAASRMVRPGGKIYINVPAFNHLFSSYDVAAGHLRRYNSTGIKQLVKSCELELGSWTYWGAPLVPLLWARRAMLAVIHTNHPIRHGFEVRKSWINNLLIGLSQFETVPQHFYGTSMMACVHVPS